MTSPKAGRYGMASPEAAGGARAVQRGRGPCENDRRVPAMRSGTMKQQMLSLAAVAALGFGCATPADAQGRGGPPTMAPSKLRAVPAETTAAKVKDPSWRAPRTPWGHPDLEGVWTSDDMRSVPMSRAPQYGTRESLTAEEFGARASGDEGSRDRAVNQETIL